MTEFISYPRTMHLFGSKIANDDKMLSESNSKTLLSRKDATFIWESKLDGSNVAVSAIDGYIKVQNRSHILDERVHPQYYVLKAWAATFSDILYDVLKDRYVMFGEYTYAVHTIKYRSLKHYFNEFDIWDREKSIFLDTPSRKDLLKDLLAFNILVQVPVVHTGNLTLKESRKLMDHAPIYGEDRPEGVYLKVEKDGQVIGRYKLVRDEFIQSIIDGGEHWVNKPMEVQGLADGIDIFKI